jgi:hypothetical protein
MKIRVGYELIYDFPQPTPIIMVLGTHFTRASDVVVPAWLPLRQTSFRSGDPQSISLSMTWRPFGPRST